MDWGAEMTAVAIACGRDVCLGTRLGACVLDPEWLLPMEQEALAWIGVARWWKWFTYGWVTALSERWPEYAREELVLMPSGQVAS